MAGICLSLELLEALVRKGVIVGAEGADAQQHLDDCSNCRTRLAEMREADEFIAAFSQRQARDSRRDDSSSSTLQDDFPGYAVEAIVEVGGQGAIHRARQLATGRVVAIKVPLGDGIRHPARRYRFRREIELTSRLDHPGIVRVLGVCTASGGRIGCVMEFVEGERFDEWAAHRRSEGREGVRRIVAAAARMAEAIAYAHSRGVLHRDLKPSNVLVTAQGQPRLLDFGLAKAVDGEVCSFVTMTGAFLGTLAYAAPEQIEGRNDQTEIRTDVYALGLVLYQALAGRVPWDADAAPPELCAQIRQGAARRPTSWGGARDAELDAIVLKAIATEKERRYPTAASFADDLERWLSDRPVRARFDSRWYLVRKTAWRKRWWIAAATIVLGASGTLIGLALATRAASTRAVLADEIRSARELESHWVTIADARAAARDDLSFGERGAWDALLGAEDALVKGGLEGPSALGRPSEMPGGRDRSGVDPPDHRSAPSRCSPAWVPSSPAYWALWEMYLRTPVVASLPELVADPVVFEPGTSRVLVARRGVLERWDWRRGRIDDRIELPPTEGSAPTHLLASRGLVALPMVDGTVAVVDLSSKTATLVPTQRRGGSRFAAPYLAVVVDGQEGPDSKNVLELWKVDEATPHLMWTRTLPFPIALHAIDEAGAFVVASSLAGDLVALDVPAGNSLFTRDREEIPRFPWIGSRGRPGEVLGWGDGVLGALELVDGAVLLTVRPDRVRDVFADHLRNIGVAPNGGRFAVGLDRRGVAIGEARLPIEALTPIPALRAEGTRRWRQTSGICWCDSTTISGGRSSTSNRRPSRGWRSRPRMDRGSGRRSLRWSSPTTARPCSPPRWMARFGSTRCRRSGRRPRRRTNQTGSDSPRSASPIPTDDASRGSPARPETA